MPLVTPPRGRSRHFSGDAHTVMGNPVGRTGHGRERLPAELSQVNLNASGIDVGASSHFVAVSQDRSEQPVREFAAYTADLHRLAEWLAECGVETVVMESTGVRALFGVLEERGFHVDPRRIKNVPGRKTDVLDSSGCSNCTLRTAVGSLPARGGDTTAAELPAPARHVGGVRVQSCRKR